MTRKAYATDISDEKRAFVVPYLTLMTQDAPQRQHSLREVFNGLRWMVRAGSGWRLIPHDLPPWTAVYQQTQRWMKAGMFEAMVDDLRELLRILDGRNEQPSAVILDSRTLQLTVESGNRAGYDGGKRKQGNKKVHIAVGALGHLLAMEVTPASEQDRAQVNELAQRVQQVTRESVRVAFVDQGYTGEQAAQAAEEQGIHLAVVKLPQAKQGFVLLPRRWVVERSFGWMSQFRRLARDYERIAETLSRFHLIAFVMLIVRQYLSIGLTSE